MMVETKQSSSSSSSLSSTSSWIHNTLIRRVGTLWFIFAMMGLFSLTSNNRLLLNRYTTYFYVQPAVTQETKNALTSTRLIIESSSSQQAEKTAFDPTTTNSTGNKLRNVAKEQHSYNNSSSSSGSGNGNSSTFMPVVVQTTDIVSIPPHVVNHHVVNMNGRKQLGQGEKILVVGQPKSGTSSITQFFRLQEPQKHTICHLTCAMRVLVDPNGTETKKMGRFMGECMAEAKQKKLPLIKTCGDYDMIGQMDFPMAAGKKDCHLPQVTMLNELHDEHPDATFILNLRIADHWSSSATRARGMGARLSKCEMGPKNATMISLNEWYYQHTLRIRQFVTDHPSHALVEIDVESPDTGPRMAAIFGLDEKSWGHHNANPKGGDKSTKHHVHTTAKNKNKGSAR